MAPRTTSIADNKALRPALPSATVSNPRDAKVGSTALYFLPVTTRVPLKFGTETLTSVTCARAKVSLTGRDGTVVEGWGETPISVQWVWPSTLPYESRHKALKQFCGVLSEAWAACDFQGHALEIGYRFQRETLPVLLDEFNSQNEIQIPYLAALLCCSPFDIAIHDAYGKLHGQAIYSLYEPPYLNLDLSAYFGATEEDRLQNAVSFEGQYPADYLTDSRPEALDAWHLVGGLDPVNKTELHDQLPDDDYPVLLEDWIQRDGLVCLKVKLRGNDAKWDFERLQAVGSIALAMGVESLAADFNCTVRDPQYVIDILERLDREHRSVFDLIAYVEQPFPYDLESHAIDVSSVAALKPLFMDESAHDWMHVRLGRQLGWNGVALKTCKTQTGALLSMCWAKAHGMSVMVQDLTNPMLAQVPHLLLAAHAGTLRGVETNAMQFYPEASNAEATIHPGAYQRRQGKVRLDSIHGPGFGYRLDEIPRELPTAVAPV